jgi:thioredoxin-like negative regulator of GroEL
MKILLLLMLLQNTTPATTESHKVSWLEDVPMTEVVSRAQDSPARPILIDFYATWCRPCKMLDVMVYNEDEVIKELANVLTFKVDIDKPQYHGLKNEFNITILPTLVWLDERGRELDRFTGYQNKDEFLEIVRSIRQGGNTFFRIIDLQAASPEDPGLLFDLARRYAEQGDLQRAEILYRRLMGLRFHGDKSVVSSGMLGLATREESAGRPEQARGLARRAATIYNADDSTAAADLMGVAEFQAALGDTVGVLNTYRTLIHFDDSNHVALDGFVRMAVLANQELEQATKYGLRAVIMSDSDPRVMNSLADCYASRRLYNKAKRWMKKALAADPENKNYADKVALYDEEMKKSPFKYRGRRR